MCTKRIRAKLDHIYNDLETNVTRIFERQNLHFALDLVYHSVLRIPFSGELKKGYLESLIIGDTRCGKTETCKKYLQHYQLGAFAGGEQTTYAGLVGGLEQLHSRWVINWGKIPLNNKRLLVIDEMSGMDPEVIAAMSQIRSSGIAEIVKVRSAKTNARTRLAWFSNPRKSMPVNAFNTGPDIIQNLVKQPEDIARFDFCVILAFDDVDNNLINRPYRDEVEHVYTSRRCRDLVVWAWSREPQHIKISKQAYEACFSLAKSMYTKYSHSCPLVNPSEQKLKLAKMATALACRLFSTTDGINVLVEKEHVEYVYEWLNEQYDAPYFQYDEWSKDHMPEQSLVSVSDVERKLEEMGSNAVRKLLNLKQITLKDFEDLLNCDRTTARTHVSDLLKNNALNKYYTAYAKTPAFIKLIKNYMRKPVPVKVESEY